MTSIANTYVAQPTLGDAYRLLRRFSEHIAALCMICLILWKRSIITTSFASKAWGLGDFYSAAFNWSAIQVGFLFGAYAFFLSRSEPFIQAVSGTPAFMELRAYVRRTMYLTMISAGVSVPLLVAPFQMTANVYWDAGFAIFTAYCTLATYTVFCLFKVIRVFGKLERPRS